MITEGQVLDIAKDAIYYIIICSAPVLIISLVVGLIISIFRQSLRFRSRHLHLYQRLWQYLLD